LIRFDKRGTGLSDRGVGFPTLEERIDDIRAVMDAAGSSRAVLLGISEGGAMIQLFAATYPERVSGLILMGSYSNAKISIPSYKDPKLAEAQILATWGTGASLPDFAPDLARDPEFLDWWGRFERLSASPSAVVKLRQMNSEIDVTPILPSIQAPTLVIHRVDDVRCSIENAHEMAAAIPNARMVELLGRDHLVWLEESGTVLSEIRNFVDTAHEPIEPDRVLATVLFTDIVNSTQRAAAIGVMHLRSVLEEHFSLASSQLRRFRGRESKTLGDGILATFDGPARAVRCAQAIATGVQPLGIAIRAGLHTGEIEVRDDSDVSGIAVNIASRVSHLAGSSEVLVSSTVKDLVAGSGLTFHDLGPHAIKGH
jgi:class 3 adenylate cyclase